MSTVCKRILVCETFLSIAATPPRFSRVYKQHSELQTGFQFITIVDDLAAFSTFYFTKSTSMKCRRHDGQIVALSISWKSPD